jgi:hypothetical protein
MSPDSSCEAIEKSIWFGRSSFGERHHRTHNNSSLFPVRGMIVPSIVDARRHIQSS